MTREFQLVCRGFTCLLALVLGCTGDIGDSTLPPDILPPDGTINFEAVPPVVRRLTRDEYVQTMTDVVGVTLTGTNSARIPADRPIEGFVHIATGQTVLPTHVRAYHELAQIISESPEFDAFIARHSECTDANAMCGSAFVRNAGAVLMRHPLSDEDAAPFDALFAAVLDEDATYDEAASAVFQAMAQSPGFLYLLQNERSAGIAREESETHVVGGYEMASRLSYFLWGTAPDDALYAAAADGRLDTREGVQAEAMRLLGQRERVRRSVARFLIDWGRLESLPDEDGLKDDLIQSAVAYYVDRVENEADLFALFSDPEIFLSPRLAEAYGEAPGADTTSYAAPGAGGLLGQPGIVAGMTNADGGEIVARGLFLLNQLFCGDSPDPPASLQDAIDDFIAELPDDASDRQIAEARLERDECASCHSGFDPLAYAFEIFDHRGLRRTMDGHGNVLHSDGWVPASLSESRTEEPYADFESYMELLAGNARIRACLVQRQVEYAVGSRLGSGQRLAIDEVSEDAPSGDHASLIRSMVAHDVFRTVGRPE